jgi:hypothetical protein
MSGGGARTMWIDGLWLAGPNKMSVVGQKRGQLRWTETQGQIYQEPRWDLSQSHHQEKARRPLVTCDHDGVLDSTQGLLGEAQVGQ